VDGTSAKTDGGHAVSVVGVDRQALQQMARVYFCYLRVVPTWPLNLH